MLGGRSLPHAAMMMIPEAYRDRDDLPEDLKGFYAFHSCLMEPWDGPASVAFTDGRVVGATLDRNGLRPGRWVETTDGHVVLGSESGLLDIPPEQVRRLGRLQPGKLFLVDLERGRIVEDEEVKREVSTRTALRRVVRAQRGALLRAAAVRAGDALRPAAARCASAPSATRRRTCACCSRRWRSRRAEPIGSMGNDLSLAVLSDQAPPLFSYFKQLFAQVTNPPIDPIREEIVMSLATSLGIERNLFDETPEHAHKLAARPADPAQPRARDAAPRRPRGLRGAHDRHHLAGRRRAPAGMARRSSASAAKPHEAIDERRQHHRPLRPLARPAPRADPLAARGRGRPPPPRARGHAPARGHHPRVGRAARGAPLRDADRLRRERDQPLRDARDARRAGRRRAHRAPRGAERPTPASRSRRARAGRAERRQGARQRRC